MQHTDHFEYECKGADLNQISVKEHPLGALDKSSESGIIKITRTLPANG